MSEEGARRLRDPAVREEYEQVTRRLWEAQRDFLSFISGVEGLELEKYEGLLDEVIDIWNGFGLFLADVYKNARLSGAPREGAFTLALSMLSDEGRARFILAHRKRNQFRKQARLES
jgi:hypothetical protein